MKRVCFVLAAVLVLGCLLPGRAQALEISAKSGVLMEVATGKVLWEQSPHTQLAPASVTKVMTMLLVMEAIDAGRLSWDTPVTASEAAAAKGGSQVFLKSGETMTAQDMLKAVAVSSANDCACALAEHLAGSEAAFVEKMNARAAELGMENTHFVNCTGLDDSEEAKNHRTTAYDIALMSRELLKNHPKITEFTTVWTDTLRNGTFGLANTNKLVRFYPGATGLKTGFTSGAGYCLSASAKREGMELIAVVMGSQTSKDRFAACRSLLDMGFASYALIQPELPQGNTVAVRLGKAGTVTAVPSGWEPILIDKAQKNSVEVTVELEEEVTAPVSRGQRLGQLTVRSGEQILRQIPMVAAETVQRLRVFELFLRQLRLCLGGS